MSHVCWLGAKGLVAVSLVVLPSAYGAKSPEVPGSWNQTSKRLHDYDTTTLL